MTTPIAANDNTPPEQQLERPSSFDNLLLKYEPFMRRRCAKISESTSVAGKLNPEDVYQEAVTLCLQRWQSWDPDREGSSFVAWVDFICRESGAKARRESYRHPLFAHDAGLYEIVDPDFIHPSHEANPDIELALLPCSTQQREVILLSAAGYTYREIGKMFGISRHLVQLRAQEGYARIKRRVGVVVAANDNVKVAERVVA